MKKINIWALSLIVLAILTYILIWTPALNVFCNGDGESCSFLAMFLMLCDALVLVIGVVLFVIGFFVKSKNQ